jgi:prepilin-type N-terminal cleavage/methylation domain-containing protein
MTPSHGQRIRTGFTLIELVCAIAIIMVLAGLVMGPAGRALQRVRADQWSEESTVRLRDTVDQLRKHFQGRHDFAPVTLAGIEAGHLVGAAELDFLKDRRVTFVPFEGSDPDEKTVIQIEWVRGFWTEAGLCTETKGAITRIPQ